MLSTNIGIAAHNTIHQTILKKFSRWRRLGEWHAISAKLIRQQILLIVQASFGEPQFLTLQWQIQDSPDGGRGAENCMKMKEIGPRRGALGTPKHWSTVDDKYLTSQIICLAVTPCCDLTLETTSWRHISFFHGTGRERLIRSHSSARFCFELSRNSN